MLRSKYQTIFCMLFFISGFFLIDSPLLATDWMPLINQHLSDNWTTKGAWLLQDDGVIHLPEREYKHWKNYENYLVLKGVNVTNF